MIKNLLLPKPIWKETGLSMIRILIGIFMIYHGTDTFNKQVMTDNVKWLVDSKFPMPEVMTYIGKGSEFLCGILFMLGLFTRFAVIPLMLTMLIITFGLGHGKIFMDDQYPFLFALIFLLYFFTGSGSISLDYYFFRDKQEPEIIQ